MLLRAFGHILEYTLITHSFPDEMWYFAVLVSEVLYGDGERYFHRFSNANIVGTLPLRFQESTSFPFSPIVCNKLNVVDKYFLRISIKQGKSVKLCDGFLTYHDVLSNQTDGKGNISSRDSRDS